jgi:DNA-binding winged helix-turn-helix (wHTH) protein
MRWEFQGFVYESFTRDLRGITNRRLGEPEGKVLEFLIRNFGREYSNEQIARYAWGVEWTEKKLYKAIEILRKILGGERESFIGTRPFRLVVEPKEIEDDDLMASSQSKVLTSHQVAGRRILRKATVQLESRSLPSDLENRIDALQLASPVADAVRSVLAAEKFPTIMTLSADVVINPIWEKIPLDDRQRLAAEFSPFGFMLRRFMDIDVCLLRANDAKGNPYLLNYFSGKPKSGWQVYLFLFRSKSPGESEQERQTENAKIIAGYFLMFPSDFSTVSLGDQFVVSVKPDVGYSSELVTYIFKFCSVTMRTAPDWLSCIEPQLKNGQSVQKFRWVHAGELELDDRSVLVNGDVLRGIHQFFGTSIPSVPVGFPGILETGN